MFSGYLPQTPQDKSMRGFDYVGVKPIQIIFLKAAKTILYFFGITLSEITHESCAG